MTEAICKVKVGFRQTIGTESESGEHILAFSFTTNEIERNFEANTNKIVTSPI